MRCQKRGVCLRTRDISSEAYGNAEIGSLTSSFGARGGWGSSLMASEASLPRPKGHRQPPTSRSDPGGQTMTVLH